MVKKAAKQPPHLRIRIDPKLIARLEKSREANGHTLTGEIVSRLEESFAIQDRIAEHVAAQEQFREAFLAAQRDAGEAMKAELEAATKRAAQREQEAQRLAWQAAVLDILLGENVEAKDALRAAALLLADKPGASAAINAAVEKERVR